MRLIDADAFLKSEIKRCGCVPVIGSCSADNEIFKFILEQQPTVEPVRGKWKINLIQGNLIGNFKCSVCNGVGLKDSNFCPNCGADMRGEE